MVFVLFCCSESSEASSGMLCTVTCDQVCLASPAHGLSVDVRGCSGLKELNFLDALERCSAQTIL